MATGITWFNALAAMEAQQALAQVCPAPGFVTGVLTPRPYADDSDLFDTATRVLAGLPETEVDAAVSRPPQLEEIAGAVTDPTIRDALARGYAAYEAKFGKPCLLQRGDRSDEELLAALESRLENDLETEREIRRAELANITRHRLLELLSRATADNAR
jgi:2-oxo-4-hydroxy-4-carboxy-5-ureidoimidazoline decarboxylase